MKIAVIGATGTIGSLVTANLAERGHTVTAIARNPEGAATHANISPHKADLFKFPELEAATAGRDRL